MYDQNEKRFESHAALSSLFILVLLSLPLVLDKKQILFLIFFYVHCDKVLPKKKLISALRSRRHHHEKIFFSLYVIATIIINTLFKFSFIKNVPHS